MGQNSCTYDMQCPGREKCCHVMHTRGDYHMRCRYPDNEDYY